MVVRMVARQYIQLQGISVNRIHGLCFEMGEIMTGSSRMWLMYVMSSVRNETSSQCQRSCARYANYIHPSIPLAPLLPFYPL